MHCKESTKGECMSAWTVSKVHIDIMVWALIRQGGFYHRGQEIDVNEYTADEIGRMLWTENFKSVNYRYDERKRTPPYVYAAPRFAEFTEPGFIAKQVACYEYQTCEHKGWPSSKAYSACSGIARYCMRQISDDDAEWGV